MTNAVEFNLAEHVKRIVPSVFTSMTSVTATLSNNQEELQSERISGAIGIAGDNVNGAIYLHFPEALARQIARAMLEDTDGATAGDNEANDVVGELSNIICGGVKSALNDANYWCALSTPSVIRGSFKVEAGPDMLVETFYFVWLGQRFAVETHLKFD